MFFLTTSVFSFKVLKEVAVNELEKDQDNTVLIRKIKGRIISIKNQREKLKTLKKWTEAREKSYLAQIEKLENGLKKLGYKETIELSVDEKIRKLQKQLKYLNNNKTNQRNSNNWSTKNELIYQKKAGVLIDSIVRLKMGKN